MMLLQRLQFILLIILLSGNIYSASNDSLKVRSYKHQIGIGLVGPMFSVANAMEGRPVWHNSPMLFSYAYQCRPQLFLRTELQGSVGFNLQDEEGILKDFSKLDSLPEFNAVFENHLYVLRGKQNRLGINIGLEWMPFASFKYLTWVNGFTLSTNQSDFYTRIQHVYTNTNGSGIGHVTGTEYYYRITNLCYKQLGGYSQLRFSYPVHHRISISVDGYLYWVWNKYDRSTYTNFQPNQIQQNQYTIFETLGRISAGISFFF